MGFDPRKIPYLAQARRFLPGLRAEYIVTQGEKPAQFASKFDCPDDFKEMRGGPFF